MSLLHFKVRGGSWGSFGAGAGVAVRDGKGPKHCLLSASRLATGLGSELEPSLGRRAALLRSNVAGTGCWCSGEHLVEILLL